ncbi:MAG: TetR/AcrR family transcriptional regulator [Alphaproteobacteria bacterium]
MSLGTDDKAGANSEARARAAPGRRPAGEDTKQAILRAACKEFAAHGFSGATVRAIGARAGVNHSMIKYYFQNKGLLWRAAVASLFRGLWGALDFFNLERSGLSDLEIFKTFMRRYVRFCAEHPEFARIMVQENLSENDRVEWTALTFTKPGRTYMQPLFDRLRQAGHLPDIPRISFDYIFVASAQMMFVLAPEVRRIWDYDPLTEQAIESHTEAMITLFLRDPPEPRA